MTEPRKVYGKSRGVEVTDDTIAGMVEEAEAGYNVEALRRRGPRPRDLNQRAAAIVEQATDRQAQGEPIEISRVTSIVVIEGLRFQQDKPIAIKKAAVTIT